MRNLIILFIAIFFSSPEVKSQAFTPFGVSAYPGIGYVNHIQMPDSLSKSKWSVSKFSYLSTGVSFYNGGHTTMFAAPMGLQLNRRLNNNLYAFGNVAVTPAFISLNPTLMPTPGSKNYLSNPFKSNSFSVNPSVSLGLMYINDAKTFSISGSISAERSSYPMFPYYPAQRTQPQVIHSAK